MNNAGSGGGMYQDFKLFSKVELQKHLGLYILNGLSPSPQVAMEFQSHWFKVSKLTFPKNFEMYNL